MRKAGRAALLSHLEFMTAVQRAVKRAGIPVRWSAGFHPAPRIGFGDALPLGVASETELLDLDLASACAPAEVMATLNRELPEGIAVLAAREISRRAPSAAASLATATYRVPLPAEQRQAVRQRTQEFLAAASVELTRTKQGRSESLDLRPWVETLTVDEAALWLTLTKGSPLPVAAHLLDLPIEAVRALGICKTAITLHEPADDCENGEGG